MKLRAFHWLSLIPFALFGCDKASEVHIQAQGLTIDSNGGHFTASGDLTKLQDAVNASGPLSSQSRSVDGFHALEVGNAIKVEFTKGDTPSVQISARQSILDKVKVQVSDGVLRVGLDGIVRDSGPVTVKVTGSDLDSISASGASEVACTGQFSNDLNVTADGASKIELDGSANKIVLALTGAGVFNAASLASTVISGSVDGSSEAHIGGKVADVDLALSGAANVHLDGIDASTCEFKLDGGSEMEASGQTNTLKVTATGAASANLPSLVSQECEAEADGGSHIHVNAVKSLKANASGAAEVGYTGKPLAITRDVDDTSSSVKADD